MTAFSPLALSRAMYDHIHRGEWDRVPEFMADDFVIHEPSSLPYGGDWHGKDALQRLYTHVFGYWRDPAIEWLDLTGGEKHAVALLHFSVTTPDGERRFDQHIAEVTRFDDAGKMASMRIHYFDTGEMARLIAGGQGASLSLGQPEPTSDASASTETT